MQHFATFVFVICVLIFQMELNLLNTGFSIIETGLLCGSDNSKGQYENF